MSAAVSWLIQNRRWQELEALLAASAPGQQREIAALCLQAGRPTLAAQWSPDPLTRAAAQLRMGQGNAALSTLASLPPAARPAVLRARAYWQAQNAADYQKTDGGQNAAQHLAPALALARQAGDAGATVAAAALAGETLLATPHAALRAVAEGLKVAEQLGQEADAYLLAVLAHAQRSAGGDSKALKTAAKALERGEPGSPARAVAYLAHGETAQALQEAQAGQLGLIWLRPFQKAVQKGLIAL